MTISVCRTEHKNRIPKIRPPTGRTMRKVGGLFYPQNPKKEVKDLPRNGMSGGWFRLSSRVLFVTFRGDESSPLHCVIPFIHTGYIRNVAGRLAAPTGVIPFNHTGCIRDVAGGMVAAPTGVLPLRPLFLQCGTPYRASSTAYGGPPSPKGKVLGVVPFIPQ